MLLLCFSCFIGEEKRSEIKEKCKIIIKATEELQSIIEEDENHGNMEKTSILTLPSFKLFVFIFLLLFYVSILVTFFYL